MSKQANLFVAAVVIKFVTENNMNSNYINHIQIDIFISYTIIIATYCFCFCLFVCFFVLFFCFVLFFVGGCLFLFCVCVCVFLELGEYSIAGLISCLFGRWDQEKPHRKEL